MYSITPLSQRRVLLLLRMGLLAACSVPPTLSAQAQTLLRATSSVRMPQGAFLRKPSPDVARLVEQVKSDHTVAVRYARLFHLPVKMVPLAFAQLRLKPLTADHIMEVHYVKDGEKLVFKPRRVKQGTPVYCLPDGTPLLVRVCGNPIRSRLSPEMYSAVPVPNFNASEILTPRPVIAHSNIADSTSVYARSIPPPQPVMPVVERVAEAVDVLTPLALPIAPPLLTPPALKAASLPPVYNWVHPEKRLVGLAPLALLPLLSFGGSIIGPIFPGGDTRSPISAGSSIAISPPLSSGETPTGLTGDSTPLVTPEPGAMTLVLTALLGAGFLARRRKQRFKAA